ncbi:cell envelope biogenesis protein TolA [Bradyrhizobium sp. 186]|uniref:cell envelope biogenesis protein TolA n=1 Tax=Bradyrhizobium sp. 186 TaxID=2782654 RepID=UPI00200111D9|nr:cell envelope biogenesis protein TolA [Bradyrhizobium sp. 186]UPK35176.1 cell envelope biogenesis protein TolA [Bradyrhizobium sp. 186]
MVRKLKTFQTSLGFYDLVIAAPSMKAALEAWGAGSNLFHQGFAKETDDPDIVAVTMSKPGLVLRRPAGSNGPFAEHADLPDLDGDGTASVRKKSRPAPKKHHAPKVGEEAARKAAAEFERERRRREAERRKEEAAREKERARRDKLVAKAQAALDKAQRQHEERAETLDVERAAIEKRIEVEDNRWEKDREKLMAALRRARN